MRRSLSVVLSIVVLLAVWWALAAAEIWDPIFLPSPGRVADAFVYSVTSHNGSPGYQGYYLWEHLGASLWRILRGLFWAILFGVPLGVVLATVAPIRAVVEPYVDFLRALPPLAYFSLLIIWFGIEDSSKVWLLFLASFPPITLATLAGVRRIPIEYLESARSLGAGRWQVVVHTVLPSTAPDVLTGIRIALGFAWTTIVAAETSNGIPGIGGLAWATKKELLTDVAILCVITIGLTALALDAVLRLIQRALVPWAGRI
ncbi:ABC transporter permease [Cryptosporangium sp. NPDC051539]|uniref:ABC transporter permease n=1 Tax=Cryptosporangium sp. NPDC051539 TaxID=3363962 RepID=UPI00379EEFAC